MRLLGTLALSLSLVVACARRADDDPVPDPFMGTYADAAAPPADFADFLAKRQESYVALTPGATADEESTGELSGAPYRRFRVKRPHQGDCIRALFVFSGLRYYQVTAGGRCDSYNTKEFLASFKPDR